MKNQTKKYITHSYPAGVTTPEQKRAHRRAVRAAQAAQGFEGVPTLTEKPTQYTTTGVFPLPLLHLFKQPEPAVV